MSAGPPTDHAAAGAALRPCTVLMVEDCSEDRTVYTDYLEREAAYLYTFLHAEGVDAGLQTCRHTHVDCVLLDYGLPDGNALDFLERLAESPEEAAPVVVITGRGSERTVVECLRLGAADYLPKADLQPEVLGHVVRQAVERGRMQARLDEQRRERELAEADLRESEARFGLLVDSVRDYAIFMLDPAGHVASWNAGARELLGLHGPEIIGQHVRRLFPEEAVRARRPEALLEGARAGRHQRDEGWMVGRNEQRIFMVREFSPVLDDRGVLRGFSTVLRDLSERRRLESQVAAGRPERMAAAVALLRPALTHASDEATGLLRRLGGHVTEGRRPAALIGTARRLAESLATLQNLVGGLAASGPDASSPPATLREADHGRRERR